MSDQTLGVLGATPVEGQTPVEPAGNGAAQPAPQQPQPAADELAAMEQRIFDKLNSSLMKLTAGQENRIKKEYDQRITQIEARYAALGKEVPQTVRDRIADEVASDFDEGDSNPQPAQTGAMDPQAQTVLNRAHQIAQKYGVQLVPDDAEYKTIKANKFNPTEFFEFLESVEEAAKAKAARLATERQQRAGPPGSAAPMSVQGAPASSDLMVEYRRKLDQTIQQFGTGSDAVLRLRTEYRRKGLNI